MKTKPIIPKECYNCKAKGTIKIIASHFDLIKETKVMRMYCEQCGFGVYGLAKMTNEEITIERTKAAEEAAKRAAEEAEKERKEKEWQEQCKTALKQSQGILSASGLIRG